MSGSPARSFRGSCPSTFPALCRTPRQQPSRLLLRPYSGLKPKRDEPLTEGVLGPTEALPDRLERGLARGARAEPRLTGPGILTTRGPRSKDGLARLRPGSHVRDEATSSKWVRRQTGAPLCSSRTLVVASPTSLAAFSSRSHSASNAADAGTAQVRLARPSGPARHFRRLRPGRAGEPSSRGLDPSSVQMAVLVVLRRVTLKPWAVLVSAPAALLFNLLRVAASFSECQDKHSKCISRGGRARQGRGECAGASRR